MGWIRTTWVSLERRWESLSQRQRVIAGFFATWFAIWCLDKIANAVWGDLPPFSPIAVTMGIFQQYILNGYVGTFLAGAILIGFWSNIGSSLRRFALFSRQTALIIGAALSVVFCLLVGLYLGAWVGVQDDVRLFVPAASLTFNSDKSGRNFEDKQPWMMERFFRDNTKIVAMQKMRSEAMKWIAITGKIKDAAPAGDGNTLVTLKEHDDNAVMAFGKSWLARFNTLNKGERIYAVCKMRSVSSSAITFDQCELAAPGRIIPCGFCGVRLYIRNEPVTFP
jgi:hypothetical protein